MNEYFFHRMGWRLRPSHESGNLVPFFENLTSLDDRHTKRSLLPFPVFTGMASDKIYEFRRKNIHAFTLTVFITITK